MTTPSTQTSLSTPSAATSTARSSVWTWGTDDVEDDADGELQDVDDGETQTVLAPGGKDGVIFLIDASATMYDTYITKQGDQTTFIHLSIEVGFMLCVGRSRNTLDALLVINQPISNTLIHHAHIQAAYNTLCNKIISSDSDMVAVVFFGAGQTKNPNSFSHIFVYQDLDVPEARRIIDIDALRNPGVMSIRLRP